MMVKDAADYSEGTEKDVDIEKGKSETTRIVEYASCLCKFKKSLQKQFNVEMGGKYLQLLMNQRLVLPNISTRDKTAPQEVLKTRKMRRQKSIGSFSSRKVALLFSVLSSMVTMILIYLTLRVKQIGDASSRSA